MRRVNIFNDLDSRRNIATATPSTPVTLSERVTESSNKEEDGKTKEVQGSEDNTSTVPESETPPKRGRKTKGDVEKVQV